MTRHSIPLGRILGIPVDLDYSWFLIFALLTWMLAANYYPAEFTRWPPELYWLMGALTAILLFASVLLHELGHAVVAMHYQVPVRRITLLLFGGVAQIGAEPPSAKAEFWIAIAGPLVSLALGVFCMVVQPAVFAIGPLWGLIKYLAYINLALAVFNLIPGYPLDGGRVFRAFLWAVTKNLQRATYVAANTGRFFGFLFIFIGVWHMFGGDLGNGMWLAFIGWFLDSAASAQVHAMRFQGLLAGHKVAQAMSSQCAEVPEDLTLQQLVDEHILGGGQRCLLVTRGGAPVGLVTLPRLREVPRSEWATTTTGQAMVPLEKLRRVAPDTGLWPALQQMDRAGVNQLPVVTADKVVGMLRREDVISFLRTVEELGA